ncbi:MAG: hypothetical protein ABI402_09710 [Ferruginibacter sp.]
MKINILIAFLAVLIFSIAALFEVNYLDYEMPVPYSKFNAITFYDFKGLKKPAQTLNGAKEFAFISTSRETRLTNDHTFIAITYFHPSRSYVFNQHIRNAGLLTHELYHFHISEYFTRLIRKAVFEYQGNISQSAIDDIVEMYNTQENEMQMQYDEESYHSYVLAEQKRWEKLIDNNLASLIKFSDITTKLKN